MGVKFLFLGIVFGLFVFRLQVTEADKNNPIII
jgi:hypothetical protein